MGSTLQSWPLKISVFLVCLIAGRSRCNAQDTTAESVSTPVISADPQVVFQDTGEFADVDVSGDVSVPWPQAWSIDGQTPYIQRFGAGYRVGDGLGFQSGFTDLEWMIPIRGDAEFDNFFADLHFLINNDAKVAGNVTLAYRRYLLDQNRILGGYVFWDGTQTPLGNQLQQLGLGVETMGPIVDARLNLYLPDQFDVRAPLPNRFAGHNLIVNRAEVAMTGIDAEVGVNLPVFNSIRSRVLGGGYNFDGQGTQTTAGWKVRAEAEFNRQLWIDTSYQSDNLFGQTVNVAFTWRYSHRFLGDKPSPASMDHKHFRAEGTDATYDLSDRLSDPIRRVQHVVITQDVGTIATTPGGDPLKFLHVVNGAAGNGRLDNPYGTLTNALADPDAGTGVIYTPEGGTFIENVTLVDGARVLSNGPVQTLETQFGEQRLPFSGTSPDLTNLPSVTGNVTMATNAIFSGFDVTGGVTSVAETGFTLRDSVINNAGGDAVSITGATASTLTNLKVTSGAGRGVFLNDSSSTITDLTVAAAATNGLEITTAATARTVTADNLTVEASTGHGVDLNVGAAGNLTYTQTGTADVKSIGNAFDAALGAASTGNLNLNLGDWTLASAAGAGVNLDGTAGTGKLNVVSMGNGTISKATTGGFLANEVTFDSNLTTAGIQQVTVTSLTIGSSTDTTQVKGDGLRLIDTTGTLAITTLNVFNDTGTGVLADTSGGGTTFTLATTGGQIKTTAGPALSLNTITSAINLGSIQSDSSPTNGVLLDTVSGALSVGTTTLNQSVGKAILIENTPAPLSALFGNTTIHSTVSTLQSDNVDTTTGNGTNLTLNFTSISIVFP